jgi:hypothetical protein
MDMMALPSLKGWLPMSVVWEGAQPVVEWCHFGERRFTEPFFRSTVGRCMRHPFNLLFVRRTPIATLMDWQEASPGLPPRGFIFHMSRCGSTLVSQMMAALPQNVMISEPPAIDAILNAKFRGASDGQRIAWLRGMFSALGQAWQGNERNLFVKFDACHALHLPLIRRAFPDVPWIFLCREPVEVLVSHMNSRASYLVPGMTDLRLPGLDLVAAMQMPPEVYCARVLGQICTAALEALRTGGRVIDYTQLPDVVCSSLAEYFGIAATPSDLDRMRAAAQFDAKSPTMFFAPDAAKKKNTATDRIREMAARWMEPICSAIGSLREKGARA